MLKNKCRIKVFIQCKKKTKQQTTNQQKTDAVGKAISREGAIPIEEIPSKVLTSFIILQCLL